MSQRADEGSEFRSGDRLGLDEMREALTGSIKRRLLLWVARWTLGFAAIAEVEHFYPLLNQLYSAGAGVAAVSLIVMLSIYALAQMRLDHGKRRLDELERIARVA